MAVRGIRTALISKIGGFMQSTHILNLGPVPGGKVEAEPPRVEDEFTRTQDEIEQTRAEMRRTRMHIDRQQQEQEAHEQRTKILSIVLGVLIVSLAGTVWFAYPTLRDQKKAIADMVGLQAVATTLGERMTSVEGGLNKMTGGLPVL